MNHRRRQRIVATVRAMKATTLTALIPQMSQGATIHHRHLRIVATVRPMKATTVTAITAVMMKTMKPRRL
jgi:hypothetical protein